MNCENSSVGSGTPAWPLVTLAAEDFMSDPSSDDLELLRVRELFVALTLAEEAPVVGAAPLSFSDLVAFLAGNLKLSDRQAEFLFSHQRLLSDFHQLVGSLVVQRQARGQDQVPDENDPEPEGDNDNIDNLFHMPLRTAASDDRELNDWIFPGGSMKIRKFGPNERLLTIVLDTTWPQTPAALLLENSSERELAVIKLDRPDPSFASDINIVRNMDDPDQAREIRIMQNPNSKATFLR
jgi:hypothetical protein